MSSQRSLCARLSYACLLYALLFVAGLICTAAEGENVNESVSIRFHPCSKQYDCARGEYIALVQPTQYTCDVRYDCERHEYAPVLQLPDQTVFNTLGVVLRMSIQGTLEDFGFDARIALRQALSNALGVPQHVNAIHEVTAGTEFVDVMVHAGPGNGSSCYVVECDDVLRPDIGGDRQLDTLLGSFTGAQILQAPVCTLCSSEHRLEFIPGGTFDNPFSCPKACVEAFFQFRCMQGVGCQPHCRSSTALPTYTPPGRTCMPSVFDIAVEH